MSDNAAQMQDDLAAAFNNSFSMPEAEPRAAPAVIPAPAEVTSSEEPAEEGGEGPDWRPEYESNLAKWREEADEARANAEATRSTFEKEQAAIALKVANEEKAKKQVEKDVKEAAERQRRLAAELADESPRAGPIHKRVNTEDRSLKVKEAWEMVRNKEKDADAPVSAASVAASQWEEISAPHSSVEDISAAVPSTSSPSSREKSESPSSSPAAQPTSLVPTVAGTPAAVGTPSLTLSLFTAPHGLTVSRVVAALGINLILPFINGIMLGLGEITAREGVRITRLWWKGERALFGNWRRTDGGGNTSSVGLSGSAGF